MKKQFPNPKRSRTSSIGRAGWYPYYAGFSAEFAGAVMDRHCKKSNVRVLDTWNGSGTTTSVAAGRGIETFGFDLNPVMTIVARARLLNKRDRSSLFPIANAACNLAKCDVQIAEPDPLSFWFKNSSVCAIRRIESGIQQILLGVSEPVSMERHMQTAEFSDLAAFFYVGLFRAIRSLLAEFQSSNPTWMKLPSSAERRLQPSDEKIRNLFLSNVQQMEKLLENDPLDKDGKVQIGIAPSQQIPVPSDSIDFVLTSPPYCTRIDYAAATRIELAVLGVGEGAPFETLRRRLIGTPTVPKTAPTWQPGWGNKCGELLSSVKAHPSRASTSYYHKGLCQYFDGIYASFGELKRCVRTHGRMCLVVQDSYYKDIHIDLAGITSEIAESMGLELASRTDFIQERNLARVNTKSKSYRTPTSATESVLIFSKG